MAKKLLLVFVILPVWVSGQVTNLRSRVLQPGMEPITLDSLQIIPSSLRVWNLNDSSLVSPEYYQFHRNSIRFDTNFVRTHVLKKKPDELRVEYRVLLFRWDSPLWRIDTSVLSRVEPQHLAGLRPASGTGSDRVFLPRDGMHYNGSYTRGLSFGNNQNLVFNSRFNLQMNGKLGDTDIAAAISDNQIPLQPEGNTRQLRDFDRIFVSVSKYPYHLIAGDYELGHSTGHFMSFFKKLQGLTLSSEWPVTGKNLMSQLSSKVSVAVARGKFARNTIPAREGNQGPYRLQGTDGERFIIVLSGTEKIYLDGQLLQRGLDADYIIDYNAGHITFTNRRLITKDSRIVAEFDYSVQNYQRSLWATANEWKSEAWKIYLNSYSEQDSRQPLDRNYSEAEKAALYDAGDLPNAAVVSAVERMDVFDPFRVLYERRDTFVNGILYRDVLVFSTNPRRAQFSAGFSAVGPGNGNYVLETSNSANGRIYRWVAPDPITGRPSGSFEPVRMLIAPAQQQLFTGGGEWSPDKHTYLRAELAFSNTDRNRLSPYSDQDNSDWAASLSMKKIFFPSNIKTSLKALSRGAAPSKEDEWKLETNANYEFVKKNFRELNPWRPPEFTRDWNRNQGPNDVSISPRLTDEHLLTGGFALKSARLGSMSYQTGFFLQDTLYKGLKHIVGYDFTKNDLEISIKGNWLHSRTAQEKALFERPGFLISIPFAKDTTGVHFWKAGISGEREKNSRLAIAKPGNGPDTLTPASFYYSLIRFFLESPETEKYGMKIHFQRRNDFTPVTKGFFASTHAEEFHLNGYWRPVRYSRMSWNLSRRNLFISDTTLTKLQPAKTWLGRLDYTLTPWRGALQSNTSYEISSGQERKVEFIYLQVAAGEGTHLWTDRNGDGLVQYDEVEISPFRDLANVVKVTAFTDEFIPTNNVTFNQSLRLEPRAVWFNQRGLRRLMSRFSTQSNWQIQRKASPAISPWNPFQLAITDTALISLRSSMLHTLFFNRSDPKYDLQIGMSDTRQKVLQVNGLEGRQHQERFVRMRWNLNQALSFQNTIALLVQKQKSDPFPNRNYLIRSLETRPQLTYQAAANWRSSVVLRFGKGANRPENGGEKTHIYDFKWETTFNQSAKTNIRSELSMVFIRYDGQPDSPVGFAFLQGLQPGRNFLWNLNIDRQLANNIRLNLSYEGRKAGTGRLIHVGRAQVGAVF